MNNASTARTNLKQTLAERALHVRDCLLQQWLDQTQVLSRCSLLAVGGFGRGALFLHSDIDLLILVPADVNARETEAIALFQASSWKLKLDLAISVRTVEEALRFAVEDLSFITSLLDVRFLCGQQILLNQLLDGLALSKLWVPADFFAAKVAEQLARHRRFEDTAFNNEPNLKEGPGGLRDLHTIRWIAQRHFHADNLLAIRAGRAFDLEDLERLELINATERTELAHAEFVLASYRQALHASAKRKEERLLFDHQIALAEHFELQDQGFNNRAVEQLMQRYFRAVSDLIRLNTLLIARFAGMYFPNDAIRMEAPGIRASVVLRGGLIDLMDSAQSLTTSECFRLIGCWQVLDDCEGLGWHAQRAMGETFLRARSQAQEPTAVDYETFLALLDAPQRVAGAVHLAAKNRLLGWLIPAFDRVSGRMQYDLFHAYTVDQHTLFVLEKLEQSRRADSGAELPLALEVWSRIQKPRTLFLAALFHDIAKGRGGDHSVLGADDAARFAGLAGLSETESHLISWLVHEHLTMSTTAQKRDIQDPGVVGEFANKVSDRERLDHLYLLTVADIRGTNPKLWNGWKARLLADLYSATRFLLRRGLEHPVHAKERIEARQAEALELLRSQGAGLDAIRTIWADLPEYAFLRQTADEIRFQTQAILARERSMQESTRAISLKAPVIVVRPIPGSLSLELFVRIQDRAGIFATIATQLDRLGINVLGARVGLCVSQMTHDTFQLIDTQSGASVDIGELRERAQEIQMMLGLAFEQMRLNPSVSKRIASRQQKHFQFAAQIDVTQDADRRFSVLALTCADAPGLLARISVCLFEQNLRVHGARIATFGERVEDFFVLSNAENQPLDTQEIKSLTTALSASLQQR
jgi:[protein-PII] uridylyltransferase